MWMLGSTSITGSADSGRPPHSRRITSSRINSRPNVTSSSDSSARRLKGPTRRSRHEAAEQRDGAGPHRSQEKGPSGGHAEPNGAPAQPRRDEGADGVERAVGHVDDAHDAEDQAKAGSDQEQNRGIEQ